ncbi:MAG: hypothetical protein FWE20_02035 [Defluviitaleaceae bacterium]|nr:hypothetical protein [Defluviitaleaceae bacterium]
MKSILEEFICGKISPGFWTFEKDSEYGQAVSAVVSNEDELLASLDDKQKIIFQKFVEAQDELKGIESTKNLVQGYKLGVLMTAEVFVTGGES